MPAKNPTSTTKTAALRATREAAAQASNAFSITDLVADALAPSVLPVAKAAKVAKAPKVQVLRATPANIAASLPAMATDALDAALFTDATIAELNALPTNDAPVLEVCSLCGLHHAGDAFACPACAAEIDLPIPAAREQALMIAGVAITVQDAQVQVDGPIDADASPVAPAQVEAAIVPVDAPRRLSRRAKAELAAAAAPVVASPVVASPAKQAPMTRIERRAARKARKLAAATASGVAPVTTAKPKVAKVHQIIVASFACPHCGTILTNPDSASVRGSIDDTHFFRQTDRVKIVTCATCAKGVLIPARQRRWF